MRIGKSDPTLSGIGGLVSFNAFVQREGLGRVLYEKFGHLKVGDRVVYPMHTQMQLLVDASVVGARRVFDFEHLATDPVFGHLAGGRQERPMGETRASNGETRASNGFRRRKFTGNHFMRANDRSTRSV